MQDLLACRPILHSRDVEETRAFLNTRAMSLELVGGAHERAGFAVHYNGVYLPSMWLGYLRYGCSVAVRVFPSRSDHWIHFPINGRIGIAAEHSDIEYDPSRAAVTSPFDLYTLRSGPETARLSVYLHGDALTRHLAALLDDAPSGPLRFEGAMTLVEGFGRRFAQLLHAVALDLGGTGMLANRLAIADFEQLVMTSLLLSQPHSHSEALRRRAVPIASRDVRRALEYMHEHTGEAIVLGHLVRASGVAGRTLLKHFREHRGVSPMRYLRDLRMRRAREELLGRGTSSVSEVAARWGFAHLGRFSIEYRRRFGESPSATRARSAD